MIIKPNSARWNELFGHLDQQWTSVRPGHQVLVNGLVDPSIWPESLANESTMADVVSSQGVRDVQSLAQHGMRILVTEVENSVSTGIASALEGALQNVMTPQSIGLAISPDSVMPILTDGSKAGQKVASALFAVGMSALSCAGPIGAAAAAIIGFATLLVKLFKKKSEWPPEKKERQRQAFLQMPPLQIAGSESDAIQVDRVNIHLQRGDWTNLFRPRFDPWSEWVGAPRNGGYGFAPGKRFNTKDEFGLDTARFESTGGLGWNPATGRITSVVQVGLDPIGDDVSKWFAGSNVFPVERAHVRDVGDFYASTTNICGYAWSLVTQEHASRHLYKVDIGEASSDRRECLHAQWKNYFAGAIHYILKNGSEWLHWENFGLSKRGRTMDPSTPEYLLGSALSCVAGSWACTKDIGWSHSHPKLMRTDPGYPPEQMKKDKGLYSGCVIEPRQALLTSTDGKTCLVSMYDSRLKHILEQVRARQWDFLYTTLVCAYVRSDWDAFRDPKMLDRLNFARAKLLQNEGALAAVRMRDVSRTEKHGPENKSWYSQLKAAGAGRPLSRLAPTQVGAVKGPEGDPPGVDEVFAPPFQEEIPTGGGLPWMAIGLTAATALSIGSIGYLAWRRR